MSVDPVERLPPRLAERTRRLREAPVRAAGAYVLYCMDGTLRSAETPALDTALTLANALERPLLVLFELREDYPFASDRHHRFLLEGARDTLARLEAMGVATLAHVHRPGKRTDAAGALGVEAAAVVVDDVPTRPYRARRADLARTLEERSGGPMLAVDGACLVPMRLVGAAHERAYKYRKATRALRDARLERSFPAVAPARPRLQGALPLAGDDLDAWDLGELTAACAIDHSVPPVPEFPGGESAAEARWTRWRDAELPAYARARNDALQDDGVSKLSPYLRHGMIAATRLAREAAEIGGKGADKFLDELLTWREMSWSYAFHDPDHDDADATLPGWARETLERRTLDPRPAIPGWETLARARTDDPLWNAAQGGYLRRGYLHNNLRMTWGKELLTWTEGPLDCAELLVDLNNRYGLDGGDPNSYQGLFWCLGAFDRPFEPERRIFGRVRHRSTAVHAKRLDVAAYAARQVRAAPGALPRVAVVGAGLAGLMCARTLSDHGVEVTVLDKGRRPGGRTAAKRLSDGLHGDHGAPALDIGDPRLAAQVASWHHDGVLADWRPAGAAARTVGCPTTRGLAEHLATELDVRQGVAVESLQQGPDGWRISTGDGPLGPFDRVVVAVPAPQAAELLRPCSPHLAAAAAEARYSPCMSALAVLPAGTGIEGDWPTLEDGGALAMAIRDGAKPGRRADGREIWTLHASTDWSEMHKDDGFEEIADALLADFARQVGPLPDAVELVGHRWRHATVALPLHLDCLFDPETGIGACGDWCLGPTAGDALLSGAAMAGHVFASEPELAERARPRPAARAA